ncbi:MAG: CotH kinase family protein [Bacteroidota bacterium]
MRFFTAFTGLLLMSPACFTQTFSGTGGSIPDDGNDVYFNINVSGLTSPLDTANFGLESVCINATHTWDSDLDISLVAPDGTEILLVSAAGGGGDDFTNTCFRNNATSSITSGSPPFTGTFKPMGDIGLINNGQNGNGTWRLHILDTYPFADQGNLINWNITFGNNPAVPLLLFTSSNLPIVVINTNSQAIPDEPKIVCDMGIIYNGPNVRNYVSDPFNHYNGKIAIEIRGSSSQMFPKKSYGFETVDSTGMQIDSSLLGMPREHDWILNANYTDKTLLRNTLSYWISNNMNHYAARTQHVELVINGQYKGVYILMEKIKRDNNRVNISRLDTNDNAGDSLTGGYIIKIDKFTGNGNGYWSSPYPPPYNTSASIDFLYDYPSDLLITAQQKNYIQAYVDSFEDVLAGPNFTDTATGYRKYISTYSFIDYFLVNELSKNVDGYRISTYLHKNKASSGGKLKIGPVWDYDIAWYNANYCGGSNPSGWAYDFGAVCPGDNWQVPFWWDRLLQDSNFTNKLRCQWEYFKTNMLSISALHGYIDSMAAYLGEGQQRNFVQWPILGTYVWPNPATPATYQGEINNLKQWITSRWNWLDANIPGNCYSIGMPESGPVAANQVSVYPNPFGSSIIIELFLDRGAEIRIEVLNALGELVAMVPAKAYGAGEQVIGVDLDGYALPEGMYLLKITSGGTVITRRIMKAG